MANLYVIENCAVTDGSLLQISQFQALYSLMSVTYGGDARSTFGIPDLNGRVAVGANISQKGQTTRTLYKAGANGGTEYPTFDLSCMAPHTHAATFTPTTTSDFAVNIAVNSTTGGNTSPVNNFLGLSTATAKFYATSASSDNTHLGGVTVSGGVTGGSVAIGPAGGGSSKYMMPPFIALNYMIATSGLYPMRP